MKTGRKARIEAERLATAAAARHDLFTVHVFRAYPTDMRTRCGRAVLDVAPCVTRDMAEREDWGRSFEGLAICVTCAASATL